MKRLSIIPGALKKSRLTNQKGYALPLVLIIMTLILSFASALLAAMNLSLREGNAYLDYQKAVLAGKNAVEICKAEISSDPNYAGTSGWIDGDDGSRCLIKVQRLSETKRYISVKAILGEYGRFYEGEAELNPENGAIQTWSLQLKRWNGE